MKTQQILDIVQETFGEEISSSAWESCQGLHSEIEGQDEFLQKVKEKLEENKQFLIIDKWNDANVQIVSEITDFHLDQWSHDKIQIVRLSDNSILVDRSGIWNSIEK